MNRILLLLIALFMFCAVAQAQYVKVLGVAETSSKISTSGILSTQPVQKTLPGATITILNSDNTNATIYANATGTIKNNPYQSSLTDATYDFFIQPGAVFSVRVSGTSGGVSITPFTRSLYTAPGTLGVTLVQCGGSNDTTLLTTAFGLGKSVEIPGSTTCTFSSTITLHASTMLTGHDWSSLLLFTGSGAAFTITSAVGTNTNLAIRDVRIRSTSATATHALKLTDTYNVTIDHVEISGGNTGFTTAGIESVNDANNNSANLQIVNSWITSCAGDAVRFSETSAAFDTGQAASSITNSHLQLNGGYGFNAPATHARYITGVTISGGAIEGNLSGQVYVDNAKGFAITDGVFIEGSATTNALITFGSGGQVFNVTINNSNRLVGSSSNYLIDFQGTAASENAWITNNHLSAVAVAAIRFTNVKGAYVGYNTPESISLLVAPFGANCSAIKVEDKNGNDIRSGSSGAAPAFGITTQNTSNGGFPDANSGSMLTFGYPRVAGASGTLGSSRRLNFADILLGKNFSGVAAADTYATVSTTASAGYGGFESRFGGGARIYGQSGATTAATVVTPNVLAAFEPATGAVITGAFNFAADAGSTDDYAITLVPAPTAYATGMYIAFIANTANTGACTINVNGLGAKSLKRGVSTDPTNNFIKVGSVVLAIYDGSAFQMIQPAAQ